MMTPQEKAKELIEKFKPHARQLSSGFLVSNEDVIIKSAKQCALLCVNEILNSHPYSPYDGAYYELPSDRMDDVKHYWNNVVKEITKFK